MKIITTKSSKIGSKIIRWATGEEESHIIFVFDNSLVFHSHFQGTKLEWWNHYKKKNQVVFEIELDLPLETEEKFYKSFVEDYYGDNYDFSGALFLGILVLINRLFNKPIITKNLWSSKNRHFCSELAFKPNWDLIKPGLMDKMRELKHDLMTPKKARIILENELKSIGRIKYVNNSKSKF
jgi:hypothetical protein